MIIEAWKQDFNAKEGNSITVYLNFVTIKTCFPRFATGNLSSCTFKIRLLSVNLTRNIWIFLVTGYILLDVTFSKTQIFDYCSNVNRDRNEFVQFLASAFDMSQHCVAVPTSSFRLKLFKCLVILINFYFVLINCLVYSSVTKFLSYEYLVAIAIAKGKGSHRDETSITKDVLNAWRTYEVSNSH